MRVEVAVSPLPMLPPPLGAHELAWSYLLDAVMADASGAKLGALQVSVPDAALAEEVRLRAELSCEGERARLGAALFGAEGAIPTGTTRLYRLEFGVLAPRALRRLRTKVPDGWRCEAQLSVYRVQAKGWGGLIRLGALLGRTDLGDRAVFAMRRSFAAPGHPLAYYHLSVWSCP